MSPIDQNSKKHEGSHLRFSFGSRPERSTQQDPMEQEVRMTLPRPGELINGRYVVERKLGQGQFGWVYLVRHALLDQRFAMKIMNPRLANDDSWVTRFREEARLTSLLGHEHIVFVTDFDRCNTFGYYFVMEYLEGVPLSHIIKKRAPIKPRVAIDFILHASSALAAVHDVGIAHRDLKPSNIMIVRHEDGSRLPKLLDFGISSSVVEAAETPKLYGTPAYMAPEQTRTMDVDGRADQFSLACILYEMLTGQRPWTVKKWRDASAKVRARTPVTPPSKLVDHDMITEELDAVIMRALDLDYRKRWFDMDSFAFALRTAAGVSPTPMSDPRDAQNSMLSTSMTSPGTLETITDLAQDSMVVLVGDHGLDYSEEFEGAPLDFRPVISLNFRTNARLKREWMRNMRAGGVFVPSATLLPVHTQVRLQIVLEQEKSAIDIEGTVVNTQPASITTPGGFGVSLSMVSMERLRQLMRSFDLEIGFSADALVQPARQMRVDDDLDTGSAFAMSRLSEPLHVRELRNLFSGLPFVLDEVLVELQRKGLVQITEVASNPSETMLPEVAEQLEAKNTTDPLDVTRAPWLRSTSRDGQYQIYDQNEIDQVLELVEYFKRTHNYMGAIHALRKAIDVSPTVGEFYRQLALLHARFKRDMNRAYKAIECAIQLDPGNPSFKLTREYLQNLERIANSSRA